MENACKDCHNEMAADMNSASDIDGDPSPTHPAMIKAPETRIGLRPVLSTQITAGIVAINMLSHDVNSWT